MKKFQYLLLPLVLLLTSCGEINIGFLNGESHEAGFDRSVSSQNNDKPSYSYMNNESLDNTGLTKVELTFANMDTSISDIQDVEKIKSFFVLDQEIITAIEEPHYLGVKENGPLYLGADSTYVDGSVTFKLNVNVKNVEITAKQYYYVKTAYNADELVVDEDVAISINGSGFIRVNGEVNKENNTVASTVCGFHLAEAKDSVTIKAGPRRAIIEKIAFYY